MPCMGKSKGFSRFGLLDLAFKTVRAAMRPAALAREIKCGLHHAAGMLAIFLLRKILHVGRSDGSRRNFFMDLLGGQRRAGGGELDG